MIWMEHWSSRQADKSFDSGVETPRQVRDYVRTQLDAWGLSGISEPVLWVVSELATNAVIHGEGPVEVSLDLTGKECASRWRTTAGIRRRCGCRTLDVPRLAGGDCSCSTPSPTPGGPRARPTEPSSGSKSGSGIRPARGRVRARGDRIGPLARHCRQGAWRSNQRRSAPVGVGGPGLDENAGRSTSCPSGAGMGTSRRLSTGVLG